MAERAHPAQLRQPAFRAPVVGGVREQLAWFIAQDCARIGPQIFDAILGKPALDLGERVAVLFGMLILIAEPRLPPRRLGAPISQHRIERDDAEPRPPRHETPQPQRDPRERVVDADHDRPARPRKLRQACE